MTLDEIIYPSAVQAPLRNEEWRDAARLLRRVVHEDREREGNELLYRLATFLEETAVFERHPSRDNDLELLQEQCGRVRTEHVLFHRMDLRTLAEDLATVREWARSRFEIENVAAWIIQGTVELTDEAVAKAFDSAERFVAEAHRRFGRTRTRRPCRTRTDFRRDQ